MSIVVIALLVLNVAAGTVLYLRWRALRAREAAFEERGGGPPNVAAITPLITIQILNAQELAARASWAARRFGPFMPRRIGREVAVGAADLFSTQLAEQGVRAEVRVLDADDRDADSDRRART